MLVRTYEAELRQTCAAIHRLEVSELEHRQSTKALQERLQVAAALPAAHSLAMMMATGDEAQLLVVFHCHVSSDAFFASRHRCRSQKHLGRADAILLGAEEQQRRIKVRPMYTLNERALITMYLLVLSMMMMMMMMTMRMMMMTMMMRMRMVMMMMRRRRRRRMMIPR